MLDQLGLADELAQECFACRSTVSYDQHGNEVSGRGWYFMEGMKDTKWDFALVLRQKYQEEIFRSALRRHGVILEAPVTLVDVQIDDSLGFGEFKVIATLADGQTGKHTRVKCRYLIGADGGRSFVRQALDIPFDGSSTEDKWVRIDGVIETNLPKPRTYCSIESPTHGNVLWAALDHGATRIGFAFTADRQKSYEKFNQEAAVKEAIESVKPFALSFKQVDWYTVYVVGQRVAREFLVRDCVFLAGDACHTHSSGAAQGMNTGMHDSVNLAWKLSLVLQGHGSSGLLKTYEKERLPNVERLINYDKDIARLMTMQLPENWSGDPHADPNIILGQVMAEAATFSSGLGIYYEHDGFLNLPGSFKSMQTSLSAAIPGHRAPDVELQKPGTFETTRLQVVTPNVARFYICVFGGDPHYTISALKDLSEEMVVSRLFSDIRLPISWLTILARSAPSSWELLGMPPFGKVYFDAPHLAHHRYGVDIQKGAVFVLRPDGWIGSATALSASAIEEIESYFTRILKAA
jgi:phenol 2-monooxygenase (NADPH)